MRHLALLLLPFAVSAQETVQEAIETEPLKVVEIKEGSERSSAENTLRTIYLNPDVRRACTTNPTGRYDVQVNGHSIPVECSTWVRWWAAEQERVRQEEEAAAAP